MCLVFLHKLWCFKLKPDNIISWLIRSMFPPYLSSEINWHMTKHFIGFWQRNEWKCSLVYPCRSSISAAWKMTRICLPVQSHSVVKLTKRIDHTANTVVIRSVYLLECTDQVWNIAWLKLYHGNLFMSVTKIVAFVNLTA